MPRIYLYYKLLKAAGKTYESAKEAKAALEKEMCNCPNTHYYVALAFMFELGVIMCTFKFFKDE